MVLIVFYRELSICVWDIFWFKEQGQIWNFLIWGREQKLKGQFQGQQTRGERGKKTLPAFAARLLNLQERGERGECSNKRIRTKNIFKIHMENFNFFIFFLLLTITIHI